MKKFTPFLLLLPVALLCLAQTAIIPVKTTTYTRNLLTNSDAASARTALGVLGSNNTSFNVNQFLVADDGVSIVTGARITNLFAADGTYDTSIRVGSNITLVGHWSVALGNNANIGAGNSTAIGFAANAEGARSMAIGTASYASNNNSLSIGYSNIVSGTNSIALGNNATNLSRQSVLIGNDSTITNSILSVVIGRGAYASNANSSVVIGNTALAYSGSLNVAIGNDAVAASASTAIGAASSAIASSVAIGYGALSYFTQSTAIGRNASNTVANQVMLGTSSEHVQFPAGANITGPITNGSLTASRVLVSSASGVYITNGTATTTHLNYLTNLTSDVQAQITNIITGGYLTNVTITNLTNLGRIYGGTSSAQVTNAAAVSTTGTLTVGGVVTLSNAFVLNPSALQTLTVSSAASPNATKIRVVSNSGSITNTATPSISTNAIPDGQLVYVQGTSDSDTVTFQDQGTLTGSRLQMGATTRTLGKGDILVLMWDYTDQYWYEVSFGSN